MLQRMPLVPARTSAHQCFPAHRHERLRTCALAALSVGTPCARDSRVAHCLGATPDSPVGWACLRRDAGDFWAGHGVPLAQRQNR
eukprot:15432531-Alexandrium_andersonii.AAC.1